MPKALRFPGGLLAVLATLAAVTGLALAQRPAGVPLPASSDDSWKVPRQAPPVAPEVFELGETVAIVGDEHILRGDLVSAANMILIPHLEKLSAEERAKATSQIMATRENLMKQALQEAIQRKLMYAMFLRSIPPDKLDEAIANIKGRVAEQFAEQLDKMVQEVQRADKDDYRGLARQNSQLFRLAFLMKELNLTTQRELDLVLRRYGSSLEKQHQIFGEDQLGRQEMYQEARDVEEVTYDDMVEYYQKNRDDFQVPMRAKWEQLTVRFDSFPSKFQCGAKIARLGNELFYGAPFDAVAKRHSEGPNAEEGGLHDWTAWGDFSISRQINEAVFGLPTGKLSHIIEDHEGLHIIRVIDREDAHVIPFVEAQATIKEEIRSKRRSKAIKAYLADLRNQIPVWTVYDRAEEPSQIAEPPRSNTPRY